MNDTRRWQLLALLVLIGWLLWLLAPVLTPFALAALLAYLGDPIADRLETWKLSRTAAVCVVFGVMSLALVGVVLLLIPLLEAQISRFIASLPAIIVWINDALLPFLEIRLGLDTESFSGDRIVTLFRENWETAGGLMTTLLGSVSRSGAYAFTIVLNLLLVPVVAFYLLRDWDVMVGRIRGLLPRDVEPTVARLSAQADSVLGSFLRGQLSVMLALGLYYTLGLWLVGVDLALLIGMAAGLISFVPYLGTIMGLGAAVTATLVQHGDLIHLVAVLAVFGSGQLLEGMILTPWLVGDRIGMHPVAVIFAVLAGGQLFGFLGVLLALPVAAVVMVLLRYLREQYQASELYTAESGAAVSDGGRVFVAHSSAATAAAAASDAPSGASGPSRGRRRRKPRAARPRDSDPNG